MPVALGAPDADRASTEPSPADLTPRQREVAMLVAAGLSNAAIAEQLVLTKGTVANHLASILSRLQLRSRTEVAVWAVEHGLYAGQDRLLASLEQLLNEQPTSARQAITRLSNVVTEALGADKVDVPPARSSSRRPDRRRHEHHAARQTSACDWFSGTSSLERRTRRPGF